MHEPYPTCTYQPALSGEVAEQCAIYMEHNCDVFKGMK